MPRALLLSAAVAAATAAARGGGALRAPAPPGQNFDLTNWKLQLPVAGKGGGVEEISQPQLRSYTSEYFQTDPATGGIAFWAPINGATTSGSNYPRSELRENIDFGFNSGTHVLNATVTVTQLPPGSKSITIGQLHADGLSGSCSIIVELEYTDGDVVSHLRGAPSGSTCKGSSVTVGKAVPLGSPIHYSITLSGDTVYVATQSGAAPAYSYSWGKKSTSMYFKAGDYVQQSGSSSTEGGRVILTALSTTHP